MYPRSLLICLFVSFSKVSVVGSSVVTIGGLDVPLEGYHHYGPQSGEWDEEAVYASGADMCGETLPESLSGLAVFSDGAGCHLHGVDLYSKLSKRGVKIFIWLLPFSCPRASTFVRSEIDWANGGAPNDAMVIASVPSQLNLGEDLRASKHIFRWIPDWRSGQTEHIKLKLTPAREGAWGRQYLSWWWWVSFRLSGCFIGIGCFNCSIAVILQERKRRVDKREVLRTLVHRSQTLTRRRSRKRTNDTSHSELGGSTTTMSLRMAERSREIEEWTVAEVVAAIEGPSCLLFGVAILLGQWGPLDILPVAWMNWSITALLGFSMVSARQ
mmetsp:Transcript_31081/g.53502  ORF Transcript_31081/g.53502 Transcript_31081/m.53502 type:complete len:327 (-) Transcript_31081:796-1776(-)